MSRILRRPMFRGGPVDSRGSGITSGLDKPKRGLVNEPGGYAGEKSGMDFLKNALNKYVLGSKTQIGNTSPFSANTLPQKSSFEQIISNNQFGNQDPTKIKDVTIEDKIESYTPDNEVIREILERQSTYVDDDGVERSTTTGEEIIVPSKTIPQDGFLPTPGPEKGVIEKTDKIIDLSNTEGTGGNGNEEESTELTVKDYVKMLGGDKARRRDTSDLLAQASAAFLGTGSVREGLSEFMNKVAASGPGRLEKIEQAAATLDIKDKIASKRAAEQLKNLLGTKDYEAMLRLRMSDPSLQSFETNLVDTAKSLGKSYKNLGVIGNTINKKYGSGSFGGEVSDDTDYVEGKYYIQDKGDGEKIVFKIIEGKAQEVHRII